MGELFTNLPLKLKYKAPEGKDNAIFIFLITYSTMVLSIFLEGKEARALKREPETRDAEMGKDVLFLGCLLMRLIKIYLPGRVWGKNDVMQIKYLPA